MTEPGAVPQPTGREFLTRFADRLSRASTLREGSLVLHFTDGRSARLECAHGGVRVVEGPAAERPPLIEVIGDAERLRGIFDGEKDAVKEFLAGGLRVRGDLGYLSDLAMEMGILRHPL